MNTPTNAAFIPPPTPTPPLREISAEAAILVNAVNDSVLTETNYEAELPAASTIKIMTAIVAITHMSAGSIITIGPEATSLETADYSRMGVSLGERYTLHDLLYGMLLPSGDDAATAIAIGVGGTENRFVEMMNQEATALKLTHSHFANPTGLDAPGGFTCAEDLAKLAMIALSNPLISQIMSSDSYDIPPTSTHNGFHLENTNRLLTIFHGTAGAKTGTTGLAGDCLVFAVRRGNAELIGVVLGEPTDALRYKDAETLLNWGFEVTKPLQ